LIHFLSQQSQQFAAELAKCVWENATIDFADSELCSAFFEDRS